MDLKEGIVVKTINYKETSKIIYVITEEGLESIEVKGANKISGHSHIYASLLTKIAYASDKHFFKSGKVLNNYVNIKNDLDKLNTSLQLMEFVYTLIDHISDYHIFYHFFDEILELINNKENYYFYEAIFYLKTLYLLGIAPTLNKCVECGNNKNLLGFVFSKGGLICKNCFKSEYSLYDFDTINDIIFLYYTKLDSLKDNEKEIHFEKIKAFYTRYYEEYLGYVSKSSKIMSKIL